MIREVETVRVPPNKVWFCRRGDLPVLEVSLCLPGRLVPMGRMSMADLAKQRREGPPVHGVPGRFALESGVVCLDVIPSIACTIRVVSGAE
jgi:hypothetical protein